MASSSGGEKNLSVCNDAVTNNSGNNDTTPTDMITKKRSFTQKLAIQRQVFHEMTSFRKFPLQDMAIRDVEENLKDYLAAATTAADAASGDDVVSAAHSDSDDSEDEHKRRQKEVSSVDTTKTSPTQLQQTYQEEHTWREQFTKEFLQEKSMPVVVMTNNDQSVQPSSNLTQEMENFLPFLDAVIERHFDGFETNSSSTDSRSAENSVETCSEINDKENILDNNAKQSCVTFEEIDDCQQTGKDMATSSIFIFDDDDDEEEHVGNDTQNTSQLPILWSFEPRLFAM